MVCAFVNCAVVLKKNASFSSFFNGQRWTKCAVIILRSYLNWWHNWQLIRSRRSHTLKGSHSMEDGRIFLKTRRDVSLNKFLSNEPNFGWIHFAGQYFLTAKNVFERLNNSSRGVRRLKQNRSARHVQIMTIPECFSPPFSLLRNSALRVHFLKFWMIYREKSRSGAFRH